jgi:hypothetical protein
MDIVVKTIDVSSIQTFIMVATNEYLVRIWEVAKPIQEVKGFILASCHGEFTRMNQNVRFG